MANFYYYQKQGGEEDWLHAPKADRERLEEIDKPVFISVLAVSRIIDDSMSYEDKQKLAYEGPLYFDWDLNKNQRNAGPDVEREGELLVIEKVNQFLDKLISMRVDLECCRLYATGGKGYHLEVPQKVFIADKLPPKGIQGLPYVYREMAAKLAVDTLDLKIYSAGRGRMWRTPNVKRENGRYKVPLTVAEMREMTPEMMRDLTGAQRPMLPVKAPIYSPELSSLYSEASQLVEDLMAKRKKFKPDPNAAKRAHSESIQAAMAGFGIREDVGFHALAIQLSCAAVTAGLTAEQFVHECAGLIANHKSDGHRYCTPKQREEELGRLHRYMDGNACYEFSVGGIKSLLTHSAPDLDGIPVTQEDLKEMIDTAAATAIASPEDMDEYKDVAAGITLNRFGVYKWTENGNKRICAVSFGDTAILMSQEQSKIVGYEATILVNGKSVGRQMLELDVFSGLVPFNRFAQNYGHTFTGNDMEVRVLMMRFVEQAKKRGLVMYVAKREGLDVVSIPYHDNPLASNSFLIWSDNSGVITHPALQEIGLEMTFQGHPDPRGIFKTDISKAPSLVSWVEEGENKKRLRQTLANLMSCQKPDLMGKVIGWYVSCFWKQIFQKVYGKFPLLHVNGAAGVGKTETNILMASLFFYKQEVRPLSPSSTTFALNQTLTSSASIPLIIDEYKPQELSHDRHNAMKLLFREAYNQRPVARGGGTRESDDFRSLQQTELAAPLVFIAEAAEDEAAVMERVVLATFSRPLQATLLRNLAKFQDVRQNHEQLGILGQYIAAKIVRTTSLEGFRDEFDALYEEAKDKYMLNERDLLGGQLTDEELRNKQNAKERSVYNHTVARFGFQQWRNLLTDLFPHDVDLADLMGTLEDGIYARLADLNAATTPEHIKVLADLAQMSHHIHSDRPEAVLLGEEYAFVTLGHRSGVEIAVVPAYNKYRQYCRSSGTRALFQSVQQFMHALRDSPAFIKEGTGQELQLPKVFTLDTDELAKFGVDPFKAK